MVTCLVALPLKVGVLDPPLQVNCSVPYGTAYRPCNHLNDLSKSPSSYMFIKHERLREYKTHDNYETYIGQTYRALDEDTVGLPFLLLPRDQPAISDNSTLHR